MCEIPACDENVRNKEPKKKKRVVVVVVVVVGNLRGEGGVK